ncbi:MAG: L-ribulose-5-phosphate 4-epimerase AraD [Planctomycetota bacterium]
MGYADLKERVWLANRSLVEAGLVVLTWGNASGADRRAGVFAIKPSGVSYRDLRPGSMVVVSLETGEVVEGDLRPSSDTPTHLELYRSFEAAGGVAHTHSPCATAFAQAARELPCLGTTHADNFHGAVPVTRLPAPEEVAEAYERNTGLLIVERFREGGLDPRAMPAALVAGHGPFTWGENPEAAVENALVLELAARMALDTWSLAPEAKGIPRHLLDKHFLRKHGPGRYYGQRIDLEGR